MGQNYHCQRGNKGGDFMCVEIFCAPSGAMTQADGRDRREIG